MDTLIVEAQEKGREEEFLLNYVQQLRNFLADRANPLPVFKIFQYCMGTKISAPLLESVQSLFESIGEPNFADLAKRLKNLPDSLRPRMSEALSSGQIESKQWLIQELTPHLPQSYNTILVLGGWFGVLPLLMLWQIPTRIRNIYSLDLEDVCTDWADELNRIFVMQDWKFKASTRDVMDLNYNNIRVQTKRKDGSLSDAFEIRPDLLVNCSCEHLENFSVWWEKIPAGQMLALQSNNFFNSPEHKNCVPSLHDFQKQAPLQKTLFTGQKDLQKYSRFMLIGVK